MKGDYNFFSDKKDDPLDAVCPKLSYQQRLWGFLICSGIGWFLEFCAFISFFQGNGKEFAIIFSIGNLVAIMSTLFLSGPKDQCKKMADKSRLISTIIFFSTLIVTLVLAFATDLTFLTLLMTLVQFCAYVWYVLSFIPFGQRMLKKFFSSCCEFE
ncbi:unnamed protein product (macronuclear) [Paramecium tetraurelia]|uniref:Vesicle transport protein n=1 Tax=Paramecium tetraurelia TaxID=5888 RepID=A0BX84_PARTE|nr:uncharacterized protein GSPATT00033004001 [Paramecium tetraurelia]CAK63151.1 unnamed protein product [Paramecium tetraurelia]|eukprot:XP_001430549.1 hypothetical protein (macronuclear) [Paramecium tetraurelia strain d4-2]